MFSRASGGSGRRSDDCRERSRVVRPANAVGGTAEREGRTDRTLSAWVEHPPRVPHGADGTAGDGSVCGDFRPGQAGAAESRAEPGVRGRRVCEVPRPVYAGRRFLQMTPRTRSHAAKSSTGSAPLPKRSKQAEGACTGPGQTRQVCGEAGVEQQGEPHPDGRSGTFRCPASIDAARMNRRIGSTPSRRDRDDAQPGRFGRFRK